MWPLQCIHGLLDLNLGNDGNGSKAMIAVAVTVSWFEANQPFLYYLHLRDPLAQLARS